MKKTVVAILCAACSFLYGEGSKQNIRIYPTPKHFEITGGVSSAKAQDAKICKTAGLGEEGYRLIVDKRVIVIEASTETGAFYAKQTLKQLSSSGSIPCCQIEDSPDIPLRGVVEGFYGRVWGKEGRFDLIKFMGKYKMNCLIYGPKDDPYHLSRWKEAYPKEYVLDFHCLLDIARKNHVKFYWAIHLGDAFKDASPAVRDAEYAALWNKLNLMYDIGFRCFAVFFDDYGNANASLHAEISNKIKREFIDRKGDCAPLIVCPNDYVGDDNNPYSKEIGTKADKDIHIMWTGMNVCSDITSDAAAKRAKALKRSPFVWWNWPVNDFVRCKLIMGRAYGVEEYPYAGFVSNPMENLEASKVALFGIADMVWNQKGFDSERNWRDGIKLLYPCATEAMLRFCEHNTDPHKNPEVVTGFYRDESKRFAEAWKKEGKKALLRECKGNLDAAEELSKVLPEKYPSLWREVRYWVAYFASQAREGIAAVNADAASYMTAKDEGVQIQRKQKEYFQSLAPEWDRRRCMGCVTATRHLQKAIDTCAKESFKSTPSVYERYFPTVGSSIGTIKAVAAKGQHFEKGESLIVLDEILEQLTANPGDWFGMKMSKYVKFNYVWLNFDSPEALDGGVVEISKDGGTTWQKAPLTREGSLMYGPLDAEAGYNAVRWRNTSNKKIVFKIVRFNIDVVK
ncbi:MAG: beta-N-acetylglucosaminidase domain-containing protein [Kiritimatiellae bacterium]|nr:beta-N-acetylglucosaminidase domain-containing protein [Kiritimatiellia bacterium]